MFIIYLSRVIGIFTGFYSFKNIHYAREFWETHGDVNSSFAITGLFPFHLDFIAQLLTILTLSLVIINCIKRINILKFLIPAVCSLQFLVLVMYWPLYFKGLEFVWDPRLVKLGFRPHLFADLCMHGFPYIIMLLNTPYFVKRRRIEPRIMFVVFFMIYMFVAEIMLLVVGEHPLVVIRSFSGDTRVLFYTFAMIVVAIHYDLLCFNIKLMVKRWEYE